MGFRAGMVATALAALSWAAAPAVAATGVASDGTTIAIVGGPEVNNVSIDEFEGSILVEDTAAGTSPGAGCTAKTLGSHTYAACPANGASIVANLGGGNDQFAHANPMSNEDGFGSVTVNGEDGDDTLDLYNLFKAHAAIVDGGAGNDDVRGGDGNDRINSRDGAADRIACSLGSDVLTADALDVADADCESVDRPSGGDGGGNGAGTIALSRVPASLTIARLFAKGITFRLTIDVPGNLKALLYVPRKAAKRLGIANKDFLLAGEAAAIDQAGTFPGSLKPRAAVKKKLKGLRKIPVVLAVQLTDGAGNKSLDAAKLTLRR